MARLSYRWSPGTGPDPAAIARMTQHFAVPGVAMGESWFMAPERRRYTRFMSEDIDAIELFEVEHLLDEISSGVAFFGDGEPAGEWGAWLRFVLPRCLHRAHEPLGDSLLEALVTAFINVYWDGVDETKPAGYRGFREDALLTLGCCLMAPALWSERLDPGRTVPFPHRGLAYAQRESALSASLFLCMRMLEAKEISDWVQSLVDIESPWWKIHFLRWLELAWPRLASPDELPGSLLNTRPDIGWHGVSTFTRNRERPPTGFLSAQRVEAFTASLRHHLTADRYLAWMDELYAVPEIAVEPEVRHTTERVFSVMFGV